MTKKCNHPLPIHTWREGHIGPISSRCSPTFGCGAWLPLGPSNDDSDAVRVEIRAAELEETEHWKPVRVLTAERWGWEDYHGGAVSDPDSYDDSPEWHAGYLAHEIAAPRNGSAEWPWDPTRPVAGQYEEHRAALAAAARDGGNGLPLNLDIAPLWSCPVDSQECAIRRECTNKCGRLDRAPGRINAALATIGPLMSDEEAEQVYEWIGGQSALAYEATRDAEPDCRDEDGPEVERIMERIS